MTRCKKERKEKSWLCKCKGGQTKEQKHTKLLLISLLGRITVPIHGREKRERETESVLPEQQKPTQSNGNTQGKGERQAKKTKGRQVSSCSSTEHQPAIQGRTGRLCGRQWTMRQRRRGGGGGKDKELEFSADGQQTVWPLAPVVVKAVGTAWVFSRQNGSAGWADCSGGCRWAAELQGLRLMLGAYPTSTIACANYCSRCATL